MKKFSKWLAERRGKQTFLKGLTSFATVDAYLRDAYGHNVRSLGNLTNAFKGFLKKLRDDKYPDTDAAIEGLEGVARDRVKASTEVFV